MVAGGAVGDESGANAATASITYSTTNDLLTQDGGGALSNARRNLLSGNGWMTGFEDCEVTVVGRLNEKRNSLSFNVSNSIGATSS